LETLPEGCPGRAKEESFPHIGSGWQGVTAKLKASTELINMA